MMKKKYIVPQVKNVEVDILSQFLAGSDQPDHGGAKPNRPFIDEEDDEWLDDDGWEEAFGVFLSSIEVK